MRIDGSGDEDAPHLKIKAYHDDIARGNTQAIKLNALEVMKILIPRPWYLKSLNADGKRQFLQLSEQKLSDVSICMRTSYYMSY